MKIRWLLLLLSLTLPLHVSGEFLKVAGPGDNAIQELIGLGNSLGLGQAVDEFLPPDQAFQFSASTHNNTISVNWIIADGYYLYKDKFKIQLKDSPGVQIKSIDFPPGEVKDDEFFGRMEVYHNNAQATISLLRSDTKSTEVTITASYQGCAEAGICYPPIHRTTLVALADSSAPESSSLQSTPDQANTASSAQDQIAQSLSSNNLFITVASFIGFGLLLAFTPCVFPMIPILSSILVGQGEGLTAKRGFGLSLVYVLAMASTYTIAGVLAGLFGQNLQAMFQDPWIIGSFALLFVLLALSMFGFYKIQMPGFVQSRISEISNHQKGGTITGVAVMGFLSALIVGPCVAAPLAGALIYIGQSGDALLGGIALFSLSMGMGIPLLALGAGAGTMLPKAGQWMDTVNAVFGVLLLGLAIWLLDRIVPAPVTLALTAVLMIVCSVYMGCFENQSQSTSGWRRLWKGCGLVGLVFGILLLIGAASGGNDLLQPLKGFHLTGSGGSTNTEETALGFQKIKSAQDLRREVSLASERSQLTMIDFYADWCVACKELEKYTFSDKAIQDTLSDMHLLQADVTAYDSIDKELLQGLGIIGPPAILFFGPNGEEKKGFRLVGFMKAKPFKQHIARLRSSLQE